MEHTCVVQQLRNGVSFLCVCFLLVIVKVMFIKIGTFPSHPKMKEIFRAL